MLFEDMAAFTIIIKYRQQIQDVKNNLSKSKLIMKTR